MAITLDIYSQVIPAMQEEAAARIAALVFAANWRVARRAPALGLESNVLRATQSWPTSRRRPAAGSPPGKRFGGLI
jgi:hypothetical protein